MSVKEQFLHTIDLLLQENTFDEITVGMVVRKSGLSRSSFYRHYFDKYDLMNKYYEWHADRLFVAASGEPWRKSVDKMWNFLSENKKFLYNALLSKGPNSFENFWKEQSTKYTLMYYANKKGEAEISELENGALLFYVYGNIMFVKKWIRGEYPASADECADICYNSVPSILGECLK